MNIIQRLRRNNEPDGIRAFDRDWNQSLNRLRQFFEDPNATNLELLAWPAIDVTEEEKQINLRVDLPGVDPSKIDIEMMGNALTIRGTRHEEKKSDRGGVHCQERFEGAFSRTITLPEYVDLQTIAAKCDKGVLTITAAKTPGVGPRHVAVQQS